MREWPLTPGPSPIPSHPTGRGEAPDEPTETFPPLPAEGRGWERGPGGEGLKLDRNPTHQPPAQLVFLRREVRHRAAAQLHVDLDGPVGCQVHQETEILGELEAQTLEVHLGGGTLAVGRLQ